MLTFMAAGTKRNHLSTPTEYFIHNGLTLLLYTEIGTFVLCHEVLGYYLK